MKKTIFEAMGGTYIQAGDYLIPDVRVPAEEENEHIGLWGQRHARHLRERYLFTHRRFRVQCSCVCRSAVPVNMVWKMFCGQYT